MPGWVSVFGMAGSAFALLGVALGAFAAHFLRARLDARALEIFETGVRYQLVHALALVILALLLSRAPTAGTGPGVAAGWAFLLGILLFSGSLYVLALTGATRWGAVTPFGGVAFLVGWALLVVQFARG